MVALGPGVLKIGDAGAETDYSCLVSALTLSTDVSVGDSTFKLCGTEVPGTVTSSGTLAGTLDQDIDQATGSLFQYMSENAGTVQSFIFEPTSSAGLEAHGQLLVVPLDFGGDEYGAPMTSDVSLSTVGDISYFRGGTLAWVQSMSPRQAQLPPTATGATAGTPGTWTPTGSSAPASIAQLGPVVADPTTAWTAGQYVTLRDGTQAHWDGTAWVAGPAT